MRPPSPIGAIQCRCVPSATTARFRRCAISMVAPSYYKPGTLELLVECCAHVAKEAPNTPFYFYDIPALTGVKFPMPAFVSRASEVIPTFAGLKFTNSDLGEFQLTQHASNGRDVFWGVDEFYLAAMALGARGARRQRGLGAARSRAAGPPGAGR